MRDDKNKVYVANIEWSVDNDALAEFFGQVGTVVSANVILDRDTGRSRGFGFVEFSSDKEAQDAVDKLNGIDFNKRNIIVSIARPERARPKLA